jgi:hypothetical protein
MLMLRLTLCPFCCVCGFSGGNGNISGNEWQLNNFILMGTGLKRKIF